MDGEQTEEAAPAEMDEPTLSPKFAVNIQGWENDNEAEAKSFAENIYGAVRGMSRLLDLSRLESAVIAWDYQGALAGIDRGGDLPPATPTSNEYGEGGAMSVHVLRDDGPWNVVVIRTPLVRRLLYLLRWARRKHRRLLRRPRGARYWLAHVRQANPTLFAHWRFVAQGGRTSGAV